MSDPLPQFFTLEEAVAVEALAERIFPETEDGPGATEAGVAVFIDRQLAGPWGNGDRMYRLGPYLEPEHSGHGWQIPLTPSEVFRTGLHALEEHSMKTFSRSVAELDPEEVDSLLDGMNDNTIEGLDNAVGQQFFKLLLSLVNQGLFSDPQYGGNHNLVGWKWIGFPGDPDNYGAPYKSLFGTQATYEVEPKGVRVVLDEGGR